MICTFSVMDFNFFILYFCQNESLNFFHSKLFIFENENFVYEMLFSYHGNTIKLFICPWQFFSNLKTQNILYAITLFFIAETAAISYNVCLKNLKIAIFSPKGIKIRNKKKIGYYAWPPKFDIYREWVFKTIIMQYFKKTNLNY